MYIVYTYTYIPSYSYICNIYHSMSILHSHLGNNCDISLSINIYSDSKMIAALERVQEFEDQQTITNNKSLVVPCSIRFGEVLDLILYLTTSLSE